MVRRSSPVAAADSRVQLMDLAGEAVRRQPFGDGIGIEEGAVDPLGRRTQNAMETEAVGCHGGFSDGED